MNDIIAHKARLRVELKAKLQQLAKLQESQPQPSQLSNLVQNLQQLLSRAKGPVAAFVAHQNEPDLKPLIEKLALDWVFPKVVGSQIKFYRSTLAEMQPGQFGIKEPDAQESERVPVDQLSYILVPGVAFDRRAYRLGRGKGFYDRALTGFSGVKIGVCYAAAVLTENLPTEAHDIPMDWVATEAFILKPTLNIS